MWQKDNRKWIKLRFPPPLFCVEDWGREIFLNTKQQITLKLNDKVYRKPSKLNAIKDPYTSNVKLQSPLHWHLALRKYSWCTVYQIKIIMLSSTNVNFSFKAFGRGQTETIQGLLQGLWKRTNSIFILFYLHFSFLMLNTHFGRKPIKHEACIHANISGVILRLCHSCEDVPWTWIRLFTLSKIWKIWGRRGLNFQYTIIQNELFHLFHITQKLVDQKSNNFDSLEVSV